MHQIDKKKRSIYSSIHVVVQSYVLNIIICNKWIKQLFDLAYLLFLQDSNLVLWSQTRQL